jgi:threonine dehydrogenase-like Zn-dependent dehydrogenase
MGAAEIYGVDADANRLRISEKFGATRTILAGDDPVGRFAVSRTVAAWTSQSRL